MSELTIKLTISETTDLEILVMQHINTYRDLAVRAQAEGRTRLAEGADAEVERFEALLKKLRGHRADEKGD